MSKWMTLRLYHLLGFLLLIIYVVCTALLFILANQVFELDTIVSLSIREPDLCSLDKLAVVPKTAKKAKCTDCQNMTCKDMLFLPHNDSEVFTKAQAWMKAHPLKLLPDKKYIELTQNCDQYRIAAGFHMEPAGAEEAEFPIAFNILMHKDVQQVERLLRAIYRPQNEYCIHVDAKQMSQTHRAMKAIANCFPNVHIASKQERIVYAGFSRLQADINCMSDLFNNVTTKWKYLINTAGQAFPLKTNLQMVQTLKVYNGSNDIEGIYGRRIIRSRFVNEWFETNINGSHPTVVRTNKKNPKPPYDIKLVRGSAYGIFSRGFVDFVLNDKKAQALLEWSKKTYSPDEHYWATLHHLYDNSHLKTPGGYSGKPDEKPFLAVFVAWYDPKMCKGMMRHYICIFGVADIHTLTKRREFFANKFYMNLQPFALDCIEEWLEYKVRCPPKFDEKYYSLLPYVQWNNRKLPFNS